MPLLEVVHSAAEPLDIERKRAFAREAVAVFARVLATPPGAVCAWPSGTSRRTTASACWPGSRGTRPVARCSCCK